MFRCMHDNEQRPTYEAGGGGGWRAAAPSPLDFPCVNIRAKTGNIRARPLDQLSGNNLVFSSCLLLFACQPLTVSKCIPIIILI